MKVVVVVIFGFLIHTALVTCDDGDKGSGEFKEKEAAESTQTLPRIAILPDKASSFNKVKEAPKESPKIADASVSPATTEKTEKPAGERAAPVEKTDRPATAPCAPVEKTDKPATAPCAPVEKTDKPATAPCASAKTKEPTCHEKVVAHKVQKVHKFYHEVCKYCSPHKVTNFPVGIPHEHLEVVPLYGGGYAVPVNDVDGQLISYINIGDDADFVVEEVNGAHQLALPCIDVATGHDIMVHLGSADGHLVLRDFHIGGQGIQGFVGEASCGEVIVPAVYHGSRMVVLRTAYRLEDALHYVASP